MRAQAFYYRNHSLFILAFLVAGLSLLGYDFFNQYAIRGIVVNGRQTTGQVTGKDWMSAKLNLGHSTANLSYQYTVKSGEDGPEEVYMASERVDQDFFDKRYVGSRVMVYYNADYPSWAELRRGHLASEFRYSLLLGIFCMTAVTLLLVEGLLREWLKSRYRRRSGGRG